MDKNRKSLKSIAIGVLVLILVFFAGFFFGTFRSKKSVPVAEPVPVASSASSSIDLQLPTEVEKRIITNEEVQSKLIEIGQLATYSSEYTVSKSVDTSRYLLDNIRIPGTTNSISLKCTGIVKVGYNVKDITPSVDNDSERIYIALPTASLLDNYIIWDSIECSDSNSILNPLEFSQYQLLIQEIEETGLAQAESDGIYAAAEDNAKLIVKNFLSGFEDYEIIFI